MSLCRKMCTTPGLLAGGLSVLLTVFAGGCANDPKALDVLEVEVVEATVLEVDAARRHVRLQGPAGNQIDLQVGPEVRNLAQVRRGDKLKVSYSRELIASMSDIEQVSSEGSLEIGLARTPAGAMPGGIVGSTISGMVEIISMAQDGTTLTFRGPAGELQSIDVRRDDVQAFVRELKAGDLIDITYTEAVAVEIERID